MSNERLAQLLADFAAGLAPGEVARRARAAGDDPALENLALGCERCVAREEALGLDPLTGALGRAAVEAALTHELLRGARHDHRTSLIVVDLDGFKAINDTRGHLEGDRVLVAAAAAMRSAIRRTDLLGRWGGDEFVAVLPMTPLEGAREVAQRVCERVAAVGVTASVGVAEATDTVAGSIDVADAAMYRAKRAGGHRVASA